MLDDFTRVERLFLACLHRDASRPAPEEAAGLSEAEWTELAHLASRQHVRPTIAARLNGPAIRPLVPPVVLDRLVRDGRLIAHRNLALHAELARLLRAFHARGIPVILLKGAHVATAFYGNVALREIGDLDLLVPRDQLEGATTLALELGYGAGKPFDIDVDAAVHHHVSTLRKPPCYALEIHWSLTEPRERQALDPHGLWTRAQPFAIAGAPALVLSDEDLLLHLCVHASYQHRFEFGLRSICDLAEVIAAQGGRIQWDVVAERMDQAGWGPGVSLTLRLAHTLLGVPIPAAWRAADPRPDLVGAAAALLVGAAPPVARGLSALHDHATPAARLRHLKAMVFAPREDLRRHYPHVGLAWWRWWRVYLLRARDLLLKHSGTAVRLWGRGPSPLRTAVERQQAIRMFLAGER